MRRVARAPGRIAGHVAAHCCRVATMLPFALGHDTRLYRDPIHAARAVCVVSRAGPAVSQAMSQRCIATLLRYIATKLLPLSHDTMLCIATPSGQAMRWPYCGPLMAVLWCRLGRVVAESWPYRGPWLCTHACCVTIQFHYIMTQTGNWAVAHSSSFQLFFFFHIIFFSHSSYQKTTQNFFFFIIQ